MTAVPRLLDEIHPGEILLHEFLKPLCISEAQLARDLGVPLVEVRALVRGELALSVEMALRLGLFFSMEPRFWLSLQCEFDMRTAIRKRRQEISGQVRICALTA